MRIHTVSRLQVLLCLAALTCPISALAGVPGEPRDPPPPKPAPSVTFDKDAIALLVIDAPAGLIEKAQNSVLAGLAETGAKGVDNKQVKSALGGQVKAGCMSPACLQKATEILTVERFIKFSMSHNDITYEIALELHSSTEKETLVKKVTTKCDACSVAALEASIRKAAANLLKPPEKVRVVITSAPPGATISIDDEPLGTTPYEGELMPGKHVIQATLDGYQPGETTIEVKETAGDTVQNHNIVLIARTKGSEDKKSGRPFKWLKWLGAASAVGALGLGATYVMVDGKGDCSDMDTCEYIYNTQTPGFIALGAGAVLGAATVFMFMRDRSDARRMMKVSVWPTANGGMAQLNLRF